MAEAYAFVPRPLPIRKPLDTKSVQAHNQAVEPSTISTAGAVIVAVLGVYTARTALRTAQINLEIAQESSLLKKRVD
jgi:hypothetical protein